MKDRKIRRAVGKIRAIKINQNLITFGFFLFLSSLFWFFNALNKEYSIVLDVPIKFINLPDNKLKSGKNPDFLRVNVSAFGYQVINYKTSNIRPILVDFNNLSSKSIPGQKSKKYFILTNTIRNEIITVLGPKLSLNKIMPDSIFIDLIKVVSKKVPVRQNLLIECRKQFMLQDSARFFPDSVLIKGLESSIDSIDAVYTKQKEIKDLHDFMSFDIELMKIEEAELNNESVNCQIRAIQYTEMEFKLPIYILNEPDGYSLKLFPSEVKILFNIGFEDYQKMTSDQFRLVVDYIDLDATKSKRALLSLNKKPDNVSNIRIFPQSVDYIIEKND